MHPDPQRLLGRDSQVDEYQQMELNGRALGGTPASVPRGVNRVYETFPTDAMRSGHYAYRYLDGETVLAEGEFDLLP
jgi:hypothetical protein